MIKVHLRLSFGSGYRVVQVFTEDHAALTGARDVIFLEDLNPERSWNFNINFFKKFYLKQGVLLDLILVYLIHNFQIKLFRIMIQIQTKLYTTI